MIVFFEAVVVADFPPDFAAARFFTAVFLVVDFFDAADFFVAVFLAADFLAADFFVAAALFDAAELLAAVFATDFAGFEVRAMGVYTFQTKESRQFRSL